MRIPCLFRHRVTGFVAGVVICLLPVAACADQAPDGDGGQAVRELWLNPGFYAWHFQKDRHLNNRAAGFGAEYRISETGAVAVGVYHNSNWAFSHYLGYYWRSLKWGPMRLGAVAGLVDGYPGTRKGGWFPVVLPTASAEYGRVGLNVYYIPSYKDSVNGSITFQFKLRLY